MREILFRGKRKDSGKWVEGFYFCMVHEDGRHVHHFIIPLGTDLNLGTPIEKIQVEVDPETICQYTDLTDKNGRKIFEGDIVKQSLYYIYQIRWNKDYCAFEGFEIYTKEMFLFPDLEDIKVIGNIFDNPELIGAKT